MVRKVTQRKAISYTSPAVINVQQRAKNEPKGRARARAGSDAMPQAGCPSPDTTVGPALHSARARRHGTMLRSLLQWIEQKHLDDTYLMKHLEEVFEDARI